MSGRLCAKLGLLAVTSLLMVGVLELAIRQFFPAPATWIDPQVTHLESPLLGWVLPPGLEAYTIDAPVTVNAAGYRDDDFPRAKPAGEYRVLALGDSFTFALGVRFEDLWVQQLELALGARVGPERSAQVVNAAVAGYNTRQELIVLESDGWSLDPDLVVVAFYWNDLVGNDEPIPDLQTTPRIANAELTWERGEREQGHLIPAALRDRLRQSVLLYQATIRAKQVMAAFDPPAGAYATVQRALLEGDDDTLEPYWRATRERLLEITASARRRGVPVVLMLFPMENEIKIDFPEMRMAETLREVWAPTGMPFVDLTAAYRESLRGGANPFLPYDLHPNAHGMKIASDRLLEVIETEDLLVEVALQPRDEAS